MNPLLATSIAAILLALALLALGRLSPKGRGTGRPPARNPGPAARNPWRPAPRNPGASVELVPGEVILPPDMHLDVLAPTVIVVAPQGSGKSVYAHELSLRFGCTSIVDDWDGVSDLPAGALALTHIPLADIAKVQP